MFTKTFTLAAIFAATEAVKIQTTQKYLEEDFQIPEGPVTAEQIIDVCDIDGDGLLSKEETRQAFLFFNQAQNDAERDEEFEALWEYMDVDQDGQVNSAELAFAFKIQEDDSLITVPTPEDLLILFDLDGNTENMTYEEARNAYFMFYPYSSDEEFDEVFAFLDFNGDGLVDVAELYLAMYGEVINPPQDFSPEGIISRFDWDQNGSLDMMEAYYAFIEVFPEATFDDFLVVWEAADLDNNEQIDIQELADIIQKINDGVPLIPQSDYQWLVDLYDQDRNGELSKAEAAFAYFTQFPYGTGYGFEDAWYYLDSDYSEQLDVEELKGLDYIDLGYAQRTRDLAQSQSERLRRK